MIAVPDENILCAIVEAQTRAMNRFCESRVVLDYGRTVRLIWETAAAYHRGVDMDSLLERVLDRNEPYVDDGERHGYKVALGIEFNRRKQKSIATIQELERTRPFAPREHL